MLWLHVVQGASRLRRTPADTGPPLATRPTNVESERDVTPRRDPYSPSCLRHIYWSTYELEFSTGMISRLTRYVVREGPAFAIALTAE
jgi:hypothetical protein